MERSEMFSATCPVTVQCTERLSEDNSFLYTKPRHCISILLAAGGHSLIYFFVPYSFCIVLICRATSAVPFVSPVSTTRITCPLHLTHCPTKTKSSNLSK